MESELLNPSDFTPSHANLRLCVRSLLAADSPIDMIGSVCTVTPQEHALQWHHCALHGRRLCCVHPPLPVLSSKEPRMCCLATRARKKLRL